VKIRTRLALLLIAASSGAIACDGPTPAPETQTELLLGTSISVSIYDGVPEGAFNEVFLRVQEIEERMSTTEEDYDSTELLEVNRNAGAQAVPVSADTLYVVQQAVRYAELTEGAFDPTIEPLVDVWAISGAGEVREQLPPEDWIEETRLLTDYRDLRIDEAGAGLYLERPGMGVDVGGIAKGYAADEAARILRERGVESALFDFGGNIVTMGAKPDGTPWRIGIQNPASQRGAFLGILETEAKTIVTSGNYERYFMHEGRRYHHIIDPETGYPARNNLRSVTVVATESITADALSTALYVMGLEAGSALLEDLPGVEAAFLTDENELVATPGFAENFELTDQSFSVRVLGED
jgi:thiamine biosynthesis lipoprotein